MLSWLNRNAAAVQAIASMASVLVTIVLAWMTSRYVLLTQEMARAARAQLRVHEEAAASKAAQLMTIIDVFLGSVTRLPTDANEGERIRDVPLWKHSDVSAMGPLAASVLGAGAPIHEAIQALNWLRDRVEQVQSTKRESGYRWDQFPWPQWQRELGRARSELTKLRESAEAAQTVRITPPAAEG